MTQKLIIDADPGIGDALAIAVGLLDPNIDLVAVTATAGCVSGSAASRNIQAIVEELDPPKWPRLGTTEADIAREALGIGHSSVNLSLLNGGSGLGDWEFSVADLHHTRESAKLMIDIVRAAPDEVTLLCLGPLTNVEVACERAPDFLRELGGLVCLAGAVDGGGDVTAAAEFNVYAAPEAARNVLRSPATKTLIPIDVSERPVLTFEQFDRLNANVGSRLSRFLGQLLPYAFRAHHQHLGMEGIRLREVVALAAISQPRLFESAAMAIDVETSGELTRGMTVFDRRRIHQWQTNIDVVQDVDVQGILDYFRNVVSRAG